MQRLYIDLVKEPDYPVERSKQCLLELFESVSSICDLTARKELVSLTISLPENAINFYARNEREYLIIERVLYHFMLKAILHSANTQESKLTCIIQHKPEKQILRVFFKENKKGLSKSHLESYFCKGAPSGTRTSLTPYDCRKLIRSMNGEAFIESPGLGLGTSLWIDFPFECYSTDSPQTELAPSLVKKQISKKDLRILIVDDDKSACKMLNILLGRFGIENVIWTVDGEQVTDLIKVEPIPSLVFMDTNLGSGKRNGIEMTAFIRSLGIPQPLVVSISSSTQTTTELSENQMNGLLNKPFSQLALSQLLDTHFIFLGDAEKIISPPIRKRALQKERKEREQMEEPNLTPTDHQKDKNIPIAEMRKL